jgi:hypothetical protein
VEHNLKINCCKPPPSLPNVVARHGRIGWRYVFRPSEFRHCLVGGDQTAGYALSAGTC